MIAFATGRRVLLVEDFAETRAIFRAVLEATGLEVAEAATGTAGLALARALLPDLILTDLSLPGMDGREAARRLRADPATRTIPIIAVTGTAGTDETARLERLFDVVLRKPVEPDALVEAVARSLGTV